jgi:hypothetical protein
MKRAPKRREDEVLGLVEQHLARSEVESAVSALLPELERRGGDGDLACALAARLLRAREGAGQKPDALATALDRLVRLVQRQEEQIRALRALVEEGL